MTNYSDFKSSADFNTIMPEYRNQLRLVHTYAILDYACTQQLLTMSCAVFRYEEAHGIKHDSNICYFNVENNFTDAYKLNTVYLRDIVSAYQNADAYINTMKAADVEIEGVKKGFPNFYYAWSCAYRDLSEFGIDLVNNHVVTVTLNKDWTADDTTGFADLGYSQSAQTLNANGFTSTGGLSMRINWYARGVLILDGANHTISVGTNTKITNLFEIEADNNYINGDIYLKNISFDGGGNAKCAVNHLCGRSISHSNVVKQYGLNVNDCSFKSFTDYALSINTVKMIVSIDNCSITGSNLNGLYVYGSLCYSYDLRKCKPQNSYVKNSSNFEIYNNLFDGCMAIEISNCKYRNSRDTAFRCTKCGRNIDAGSNSFNVEGI